mmetsp:Transcript_135203/g.431667  ORF Transcript_135203/g.431667 Transcript_135203/m.431667 type:complete len:250 (-) Transcript_135203:681-1430(-)
MHGAMPRSRRARVAERFQRRATRARYVQPARGEDIGCGASRGTRQWRDGSEVPRHIPEPVIMASSCRQLRLVHHLLRPLLGGIVAASAVGRPHVHVAAILGAGGRQLELVHNLVHRIPRVRHRMHHLRAIRTTCVLGRAGGGGGVDASHDVDLLAVGVQLLAVVRQDGVIPVHARVHGRDHAALRGLHELRPDRDARDHVLRQAASHPNLVLLSQLRSRGGRPRRLVLVLVLVLLVRGHVVPLGLRGGY